MNLGIKKGAKRLSTDVIELYYSSSVNKVKSSKIFSPKKLEKKSEKDIINIILKAYEKLKKSTKIYHSVAGYPQKQNINNTPQHKTLINKLCDDFGFDDWTCA